MTKELALAGTDGGIAMVHSIRRRFNLNGVDDESIFAVLDKHEQDARELLQELIDADPESFRDDPKGEWGEMQIEDWDEEDMEMLEL